MPKLVWTYGTDKLAAEDYTSRTSQQPREEHGFLTVPTKEFSAFDSHSFGLGDISTASTVTPGLAAIFDLQGFTYFSSQADPQLVVPGFLKAFFDWLINSYKGKLAPKVTPSQPGTVPIWGSMPILVKFLGDGLLLLWDTDTIGGDPGVFNTAKILAAIAGEYASDFLPLMPELPRVPTRLRLGIARGNILSIGGGEDYVAPCINIASRLQKLSRLSFAMNARGISLYADQDWCSLLVTKVTDLRGIGTETVYVYSEEFSQLTQEDQKVFSDPPGTPAHA